MIKKILKSIFLLKESDPLSSYYIFMKWNLHIGKYFYRKKYSTDDLLDRLRQLGVQEGDNIFIHSSWILFTIILVMLKS